MKNQYVGDVNDYFKYSVLRALEARTKRPLAVCWMLTEDDGGSDGSLTAYLERPHEYRELDPGLFDDLSEVLAMGRRHVSVIEAGGVLPCRSFFSELLRDSATDRNQYFEDLWRRLPEGALVFFDPDNGLEVASVKRGRRGSCRYLFLDELARTVELGHVAVVYQHFPRVSRDVYVASAIERLKRHIPEVDAAAIYSSRVAYLLVGDGHEVSRLAGGLRELANRLEGGLRVAG